MHYELDSGDPICIRAHHELLGEAINNLLDNACKYSEPGTPIRLGVERSAAGPRLVVADRGIGISPQELPQVFDPFFRSEEARGAAQTELVSAWQWRGEFCRCLTHKLRFKAPRAMEANLS